MAGIMDTCALVGLLVTVAGMVTAADEFAGPETLIETGFEQGLDDWNQNGRAQFDIDRTVAHTGACSARITVEPGVAPAYQQLYREVASVRHGDAFEVTVFVRADTAGETGAYCALQFLDENGRRVGIAHSKFDNKGTAGWEELNWTGQAPMGTRRARLDLILHHTGKSWFDDVRLVRTSRLEPWPDLGQATRRIEVRTEDVVHPAFGGVGFHVFHHTFDIGPKHLSDVVAKRWRELNPSFARLNDSWHWKPEKLDEVAAHLMRFKETGTELYLATWGPKNTQPGDERRAYARQVVDNLEYLIRAKGADNIKYYCMSNELTLSSWGSLAGDLPTFKDYHAELLAQIQARGLDIGLLATDAAPIDRWHTIQWATENMDEITAVYGGHHYINSYPPEDDRFYPWFLSKLIWGVDMARQKGKDFILGEFGAKQDGSTRNGKKWDACIYWDTPAEPLVGIQLAEAAIAAINAGVYAMGNWTFMDFPDDYNKAYANKWGTFKWTGSDYSTRAHYYAYGLLTRFFRGPATVFRVAGDDPYLRVAAVRHHADEAWSIAVVNRYKGDVPVSIDLGAVGPVKAFRKYVYDPQHVPSHPYGDMQPPAAVIEIADSSLSDTVGEGTLTVYTTAYEDAPPPPVAAPGVERADGGAVKVSWPASDAADLCYYRVYRLERPGEPLTVANQIGSTVATEFIDKGDHVGLAKPYVVIAVDQSGNASSASASSTE